MVNITKKELISLIEEIRQEIGHKTAEVNIKEIKFNQTTQELLIITPDRPDKSAVIGKGGWVVGRLKETLKVNKVHVDAYSDLMIQKYRMELALEKFENLIDNGIIPDSDPYLSLKNLLKNKIEYLSLLDFSEFFNIENPAETSDSCNLSVVDNLDIDNNYQAVVALSGGVDSSFSLIMAKYLGFNPLAVTADPGGIVLPNHFKKNINSLTKSLGVKHVYLPLDFDDFVQESFEGRFHPCGRCSKMIHGTVLDYARKNGINLVIFGDLLSTGSQSINYHDDMVILNLPAFLGVSKENLQKVTAKFNIKKYGHFGCPLLAEVQKKFPHMRRYSIQRVLRETRAGALEPGEALDLIWSLCKKP